jgi:hypothetical protein
MASHKSTGGCRRLFEGDGFPAWLRWLSISRWRRVFERVKEMLGERELIRLIETNEYPARVVDCGVVWVELEVTDLKTNTTRRQRLSKSAFADLILDWRERHVKSGRELGTALRKIGIAA